jgi:predicted  nucleic acid-binding Zn-ribbon protein
MRTRHKVPSIFNISMVDVLCCALGCVILLWLLNLREAKQRSVEAGDSNKLLADSREELGLLQEEEKKERDRLTKQAQRITGLEAELQTAMGRTTDLEQQLRLKESDLKAGTRRLVDLTEKLRRTEEEVKTLGALADLVPDMRSLMKELRDQVTAEEASNKKLQTDLARNKQELVAAGRDMQNLQAAKRKLESDLDTRVKELADAKSYQDKLTKSEERFRLADEDLARRTKELASAERTIDRLQGERKSLTAEATRIRDAAENRFEGIALTGRRVIFLVDMSGSMDLVDENTPAPAKWSGVRDTVVRILKSLPDLEKFQVIVFSEKATPLFENEEGWINFDPKTSVQRVTKALAAIKPKGGTNMYLPLNSAFRHRATGLDTIYLLSDGLPNIGEGLTAEQDRTLNENQKGEILGRTIRKKLKTEWNRAVNGKRVRINAVGFFYESPDVGAFLWALARENDGSFVGMSKP